MSLAKLRLFILGIGILSGCVDQHPFVTVPVLDATTVKPATGQIRVAISKPAGAGPWPTVVIFQGCDGFAPDSWIYLTAKASHFIDMGYAAVILDSYTPRGVTQVCDNSSLVTARSQAEDAYSVLHFLIINGISDPAKVGLFGESHGGWAVLSANTFRQFDDEKFVAGVAFYPGCKVEVREKTQFPLLLLAGRDDSWAFSSICESYVDEARKYNSEIDFKIYEKTTHSWDTQYPPRIYLGHYLAPNPQAAEDSTNRMDDFFRSVFGK